GLSGVQVSGGSIQGFFDGINLRGVSNSKVVVMRMIENCNSGISITGAGNRVDTTEINGSLDGISLCQADATLVRSNNIHDNLRYGVSLACGRANRNEIIANILKNNGFSTLVPDGGGVGLRDGDQNLIALNEIAGNRNGILLSGGQRTQVRANRVDFSQHFGIAVSEQSRSNLVEQNLVLFSGVDLSDANSQCLLNTWRENTFQ